MVAALRMVILAVLLLNPLLALVLVLVLVLVLALLVISSPTVDLNVSFADVISPPPILSLPPHCRCVEQP